MSLVFISYRREDSAGFAGRLCESLERRLGEGEVFRDTDALEPGQDFVDAIAARLTHCRACLALIGREWLAAADAAGRRRLDQDGDYVRLEIAAALARPDVLVVPVLVEGMRMPSSEELPESIRALARRQAVSLRDESWDDDVDRLVEAIRKSIGRGATQTPERARLDRRAVKWVAVAIALLIVVLVARWLFQTAPSPSGQDADALPAEPAAAAPGRSREAAAAPAYAIAIPRLAEVAHGDLIYTLLSGGVTPHGSAKTLRLRVRFSNEGRYPATFWDGAFRLAMSGQVISPTSGLNEVVDGHSLRQGIVSFDVPPDVTAVVVRVLVGDGAADIPLDLRSTGAASTVDTLDTSDALSRAVLVRITRDATPLVSEPGADLTLVSATARRFVNTLRVAAAIRFTNRGRYPAGFGSDALRLLADGQTTAPFKAPSEAVDPNASATADFVFDVAPTTRRVSLLPRGSSAAEFPLDLPAAVR